MEPREHPTETDEDYVRRVLAESQYPFPAGESLYDDLSSNEGYSHVSVEYARRGNEGPEVVFTGRYPRFDETGDSFVLIDASIHCPASVMTDPDGVEKFRARTAEMVAAVIEADRELDARIEQLMANARRG